MKYVSALACSLLLTGVGLSQAAPVAAQSVESEPVLIAQEAEVPVAVKARYFGTFDAWFPGYVVEASICPSMSTRLFYSETQPELSQWDTVYIIDGDLYADPEGTILIATDYDEANAAFLARRQAEIDAALAQLGTSTAPAPAPAPVSAPVQPAPEPVPALW